MLNSEVRSKKLSHLQGPTNTANSNSNRHVSVSVKTKVKINNHNQIKELGKPFRLIALKRYRTTIRM